jgi:5-methylcytosine-specific restriction enzyme subunit McrC
VLGLPRGHLVYAKGNEDQARHIVRRSGIEIIGHALDLSADPTELLAQIDDLAVTLATNGPSDQHTSSSALQPI